MNRRSTGHMPEDRRLHWLSGVPPCRPPIGAAFRRVSIQLQEHAEFGLRQGPAAQIALRGAAVQEGETFPLRFGLDALGDDAQAHALRQGDEDAGNRRIVAVGRGPGQRIRRFR